MPNLISVLCSDTCFEDLSETRSGMTT